MAIKDFILPSITPDVALRCPKEGGPFRGKKVGDPCPSCGTPSVSADAKIDLPMRPTHVPAAMAHDPLLRKLLELVTDALKRPTRRPRGRPPKPAFVDDDGVFNLDAVAHLTHEEMLSLVRTMVRDHAIIEEVSNAGGTVASIEIAAQRHHVSVSKAKTTYYDWKRRTSKKA